MPPRVYKPARFLCTRTLTDGRKCLLAFKNRSGLTQHVTAKHPVISVHVPAAATRAASLAPHESNHEEQLQEHPVPESPPTPPSARQTDTETTSPGIHHHPILDGTPCNAEGIDLPPNTPPSPRPVSDGGYFPYPDRPTYALANLLFRKTKMPAESVNELMDILAAKYGEPPFADTKDMHSQIDATKLGDVAWESFSVTYSGEKPDDPDKIPSWMETEYEVWFRDPQTVLEHQLANPDFKDGMHYAPFREYGQDGQRRWQDLMSGNWAWSQADEIAKDPETHGAMFAPIVCGSDKTTVSVATGQNEYYPLYASPGNVTNGHRRAQRDAVAIIGFLAIPKTDRKHAGSTDFRRFRRQLFHSSIAAIFERMRPAMEKPVVTRCADGHFRRVIYGFGPYIADYPEQVLLACVVQDWCPRCTALPDDLDGLGGPRSKEHRHALLDSSFSLKQLWDNYGIIGDVTPFTDSFPRADIHELLTTDLLHQVIKGTFKDHLVSWVQLYLEQEHGKTKAAEIMADIDRRIAVVPSFTGLRRFPEGRGFKQWTGDDSKALMKVYLPAIAGHVPPKMVRALSAFMNFCYLVRRSHHTEDTLRQIEDALDQFHNERDIFLEEGVRDHLSLPRQHALVHYVSVIQEFGSPNGLCSSITESKHIKAVKEPWRRSNHYNALGQMLLTNQRNDKLAASTSDFASRGMLDGPVTMASHPPILPPPDPDIEDDGEEEPVPPQKTRVPPSFTLAKTHARRFSRSLHSIAGVFGISTLPSLLRHFLFTQVYPTATDIPSDNQLSTLFPDLPGTTRVYFSALAQFYAPSDYSGVGGMHRERVRATPSWQRGASRNDCVFVYKTSHAASPWSGFRSLHAARVVLFFSYRHNSVVYPCALVQWFRPVGDRPCGDTDMWVVERDWDDESGEQTMSVIHCDSICRAAHLIPVFGTEYVHRDITFSNSLDFFNQYYINKFIDHQSHELAF